jgi:hypothetical protein
MRDLENTMKNLLSVCFFLFMLPGMAFGYPASVPNYPLEIIQPRPNLSTVNRFYKAYPGLEYNVRLAVIGGLYPYTSFSLTTAPSGMSIDSRGEITWPNPSTSGSPHTVTARVVDSQAIATTVTWTITVTTSGFIFMDASAPNGGNGTIGSPFNKITDWDKENKNDSTYQNYFIYWKNGNYATYGTDGNRLWLTSVKPRVWLAYPGHNPRIDLSAATINAYNDHIYFDGFDFDINGSSFGKGIETWGGVNHFTFRRNKSHGVTNGYDGGNNGQIVTSSTATLGMYWSFQDNIGYDHGDGGAWLLAYGGDKVVIEDNNLYNLRGNTHGIFPKQSNVRWFIRNNRIDVSGGASINVYMSGGGGRPYSGDIDVSFNRVKSGTLRLNSAQLNQTGPVYAYRNSVCANFGVSKVTNTTGPFYIYNNVIVNALSEPDKISKLNIDIPSRLVIDNNLVGSPSDGITDSDCNLTQSYSSYLGTHGYQLASVGGDVVAPAVTIATADPSNITSNSLTVTGTSSDAVGVIGCKWRANAPPNVSDGAACTGTTSFSCNTSGYSQGANTLHVGCYDAAGNYGPDSIVVNLNSVLPTVISREIPVDGTIFVMGFSEPVNISGALPVMTGCSGGATGLALGSGSGTSNLTFNLSRTVFGSETGCVNSYTQPGDGIESLSGGDLASFSNQAVTNNSAQVSGEDSNPPYIISLSPAGDLVNRVSNVTFQAVTDEVALCRFGSSGDAFIEMTNFSNTNSTTHTHNLPVQYGGVYRYCVRCQDAAQNISGETCTRFSIPAAQKRPVLG